MMKKLTALILVLALFVSTISIVYGGAALSTEAKACVDLGMLKGPTGTVDVAYTETEPTRLQVAIIFLRLKGLEAEALGFSGASNFIDANEVNWDGGRAVMAYLKAHPELGWIGNNGYFNPNSLMSMQAYYKVLLESLGYTQASNGISGDFTWDNTLQFAATKSLKRVASVTRFTVNDMAIATIEALKAKMKGSTKTLAEDLVEKGKLDRAAAEASGVIAVPAVFAVAKVETQNLAEVKVTYTDKVDKLSAENIKNYSIEKHTISYALVQSDGKSVILSLKTDESSDSTKAFEQGEEFCLNIDEIKNADKTQSVVDYKTNLIVAQDRVVPTVEKIELAGPYKIKLTYSEPIKDTSKANILINNGEYYAVAQDADGTREVIVTLYDTLKEGSYEFIIYGVKDYFGFSSIKSKLTLSYKKITSPPTVSVVSSSEKEVVVKFNRAVTDESRDELDGSYFYHSNSYIHPDVSTTDNQTYVLNFSNNPLPEGSVKLVVLASADRSSVIDEWGNEMEEKAAFTLDITADRTKPVVTEVKATDEQTLLLYFSEALNLDTVVDINKYLVEDGYDKAVDINDIEYSVDTTSDEYMVTLKFSDKLNGSYTIEISGIEDMAGVPNVIEAKTYSFEMKDVTGIDLKAVTATTVEGTGSKPDYIYISFPEEMTTEGQYGILNKENYLLSGDEGDNFELLADDDTIALMNGNKTVKITIKDNTIYSVDDDDFRISIGRVADKAGNKSPLFGAMINPRPDMPIEAVSFVAVDTMTVEVTFDGIIKSAPTSGFRISKNGGTASSPASVRLRFEDTDNDGSDETIASLTLKSSQQLVNSYAEGRLEVSIMDNNVRSETSLYCEESLDNPVSDGIAPNIIEIEQDGADRIEITFDEDIAVTNAGLASTDLVIRDKKGRVLVAGVDYNVSVSSSSLTVLLVGDYRGYTGRITVDTKDSVTYIYDNDGEQARLKAYGIPKALNIE